MVCLSQALSKMLANCTNTGNRLMQVGVEDVSAMRIDELCRLLQEHNVISEGRILEKFRSNAFFFSYMVLSGYYYRMSSADSCYFPCETFRNQ